MALRLMGFCELADQMGCRNAKKCVRCEAGMHFRPNPGGASVVLGFLVGEQAFYDKMINHG